VRTGCGGYRPPGLVRRGKLGERVVWALRRLQVVALLRGCVAWSLQASSRLFRSGLELAVAGGPSLRSLPHRTPSRLAPLLSVDPGALGSAIAAGARSGLRPGERPRTRAVFRPSV
jgi:hypothetical protein